MSIDTLTGDEFMHLDADTHRVALSHYEVAVGTLTHNLGHQAYATSEEQEQVLDRLTSLLQLRKLHKVRLAELEEEYPLLASERFTRGEEILAPQPA